MSHTIEEMKNFFSTELFPPGTFLFLMHMFIYPICYSHGAFLGEDRGPFKCVVKPVESAGTDDVFLCISLEEAETAFNRIMGKVF